MTITTHAQKRCQQRGISPDLVLLLNALGMETQQKGNTYVLQLDKRTQKSLCKKLKTLLTQVQKMYLWLFLKLMKLLQRRTEIEILYSYF